MSSNRERNDRKSKKTQGFKPRPERGWTPKSDSAAPRDSAPRAPRQKVEPDNLIWGRHPVLAALANPARKGMGRLLATPERAEELAAGGLNHSHQIEIMDGPALARPDDAGRGRPVRGRQARVPRRERVMTRSRSAGACLLHEHPWGRAVTALTVAAATYANPRPRRR